MQKKAISEFIEECKPIEEDRYSHINKDRLVLYAVYLLEKNNIEPTFEKIVVTAFKLFPKRFSLLGFPMYPDARWIYYSLWHCVYAPKKWLTGTTTSGYRITAKGTQIAHATLEAFSGKVYAPKKVAQKQRRKEIYFLGLIEKSIAFKKFLSENLDQITEMEIRIMLRTRKDTPKSILTNNFKKYIEYAQLADEPKILEFLKYLQNSNRWAKLLG